jgi:hypothetical protein
MNNVYGSFKNYRLVKEDDCTDETNPLWLNISEEMRLVTFPGINVGDPDWDHCEMLKRVDKRTFILEDCRFLMNV